MTAWSFTQEQEEKLNKNAASVSAQLASCLSIDMQSGRSRGVGLGKEEEEQLRSFIVNMVSEPLVLVIKLADRLHNMRTVFALKKDKQRAVATETLQVWCSLAERLGMMVLKVHQASDIAQLVVILHPSHGQPPPKEAAYPASASSLCVGQMAWGCTLHLASHLQSQRYASHV